MPSLTLIVKAMAQMFYLIIIENLGIEQIYFLPWDFFFMEQMEYIFKSIIQRPFSFINLECTFLFNIAFFFGKKKERIQKPLKMYMHFSFWLFDQMKICFCIFHYLRGGKKLTTSISFPSYYRLNVCVFSKFLCWNCNLQCDGVRSWAFGCPSSH